MELSKRLMAVAGLVKKGDRPADIGCDHGYVSIYLIKEKVCSSMIAMDINKGPLLRAKENVEREGLSPYIETRLSDGANALLEGEADTLILAGMGGKLTIHIVEEALKRLTCIRNLILQPQSEIWLVRQFLIEQKFFIVKEEMVYEDGKYYPMMRAQLKKDSSTMTYSKEEACYGPLLLKSKHPVLYDYLQWEKQTITETIKKLGDLGEDEKALRRRERKKELADKLQCIETCLTMF